MATAMKRVRTSQDCHWCWRDQHADRQNARPPRKRRRAVVKVAAGGGELLLCGEHAAEFDATSLRASRRARRGAR